MQLVAPDSLVLLAWLGVMSVPLLAWLLWRVWAQHRPEARFDFNPLKFGLYLLGFAVALVLFQPVYVSVAAFGLLGLTLLLDEYLHVRHKRTGCTQDGRVWQVVGVLVVVAYGVSYWARPLQSFWLRKHIIGLNIGPVPFELLVLTVALTLLALILMRTRNP